MIFENLKVKSLLRNAYKKVNAREKVAHRCKVTQVAVVSRFDAQLPEYVKEGLASYFKISSAAIHEMSFKSKITADQKNKDVFNITSLGRKGQPKFIGLSEFFIPEYDVLINYYQEPNAILEMVSATVKARLKVGISETQTQLNDLVIKVPVQQESTLLKELIKYLDILKIAS